MLFCCLTLFFFSTKLMNKYWHLSQSQLNLLQTCPPQFQKVYLEKYDIFTNLNMEEKSQWGKQFHLLMQQYNLGLNINLIQSHNSELVNSVKTLIHETANIWQDPKIKLREAEYQINYKLEKYLFSVIYDLLVLYEDKAIIFDWKTYLIPEKKNRILDSWQTKLYLYILAENFNYPPEKISFVYWFVRLNEKPQSFVINYNIQKHLQIEKELKSLLLQLENYYQNYTENNIDFPHHHQCNNCIYHSNFAHLFTSEQEKIPLSLDDIS